MVKHVPIPIHHNKNYKPNGPKSYVWLLGKYKFTPTVPGPYFRGHNHELLKIDGHHSTTAHSLHAVDDVVSNKLTAATVSQTGTAVAAEDIQFDSLYNVEIGVGNPPQLLPLDFDTGSSDLWVFSTELSDSIKTSLASTDPPHAIYDPSKSSTAKQVTGSHFSIGFGDGSSAKGDVFTDDLTLGSIIIKNQVVEVAKVISSEFVQSPGSGLLGLAWGEINSVKPARVKTPVENLILNHQIPQDQQVFTAYLGSWRDVKEVDQGKSFYTFGYIDLDVINANGQPTYTPVDKSKGFWEVASASATVNGKIIKQANNTTIIDTGTTLLLTSDTTCKAIYAKIPGAKFNSAVQGYVFPANTPVSKLPVVTFAIGDKQFTIQKEDFGFADNGDETVYGGIQSRGSLDFDIFGDTFLKGIYAIFDQGKERFGAVQRIETEQNVSVPPSQS